MWRPNTTFSTPGHWENNAFVVNQAQHQAILAFQKKQAQIMKEKEILPGYEEDCAGPGDFTYCFKPGNLGTDLMITCEATGNSLDLTELGDWG